MQTVNYEEIVRKCYRDLLNREPDQDGFNHYVGLLEKNNFEILEESDFKQEYYWLTFRSKK